jgi:16S rRNA (cytosine967-C5)-methyltransferase
MGNTRFLAILSLLAIFTKGDNPKQSIDHRSISLEKRDRAFLKEIVFGVLRFRDTLDWILKFFLKKQSKLGNFTLNNLRIAVYQIYFMRVPDWAVVNEAVEIEKAKKLTGSRLSGKPAVVNAVLRNLLREKSRFALPVKFDNVSREITVNTSHPTWLVKRWIKRFGCDEARELAMANNKMPPLTIRTNSLKTTRNALLKKLDDNSIVCEISPHSPDGIFLNGKYSFDDLSFAHGLFIVQDEASQLISYLLDPKPGERILDACAAPGGKTTHIAQLIRNEGEIVAVDKNPVRISKLEDNINELGITCIRVVNADISKLKDIGTFDRILIDAPCTSIGVIRRNPDVKYRHSIRNLKESKEKQLRLLGAVAHLLRKNGVLVYSVCSTEPEEGEDVAKEFLKMTEEFRIIDASSVPVRKFMSQGYFRTYQHKHNMDGFFGVSFCRKK